MLHDLVIGGIIAVGIYYLQGIFYDTLWLVLGFFGVVLFFQKILGIPGINSMYVVKVYRYKLWMICS